MAPPLSVIKVVIVVSGEGGHWGGGGAKILKKIMVPPPPSLALRWLSIVASGRGALISNNI